MADLSDFVVLGARVTYIVATNNATSKPMEIGERPHCAVFSMTPGAEQCPALMALTNESDGVSFAEQCTREQGHPGSHVVHAAPGLPVLAWLLDPSSVPQNTEEGDRG